MQITHEQAHHLIQLRLDRAVDKSQRIALSAHLKDCSECQMYLNELKEVETTLTRLLKQQWDHQPAPLSIAALSQRRQSIPSPSPILATRTAALSLVLMALFFGVWQFMLSNPAASRQGPLPLLPVPTPSTSSTSTSTAFESCEMTLYTVQPGDTLAGIAVLFSVPEADIRQANSLTAESLSAGLQLIIPICYFTPTSTVHPATFTTTHTPAIRAATSTPGG